MGIDFHCFAKSFLGLLETFLLGGQNSKVEVCLSLIRIDGHCLKISLLGLLTLPELAINGDEVDERLRRLRVGARRPFKQSRSPVQLAGLGSFSRLLDVVDGGHRESLHPFEVRVVKGRGQRLMLLGQL